jgi:hypothetical protein
LVGYIHHTMASQQNPSERIVRLEALFHDGTKRIALHFTFDRELIALAKEAGGSWSNSKRCWHVADGSASLKKVYAVFKGHAKMDGDAFFGKQPNKPVPQQKAKQPPAKAKGAAAELSAAQLEALDAMQRKLEIARYRDSSIKVYLNATKQLFQHFPQKHPKDIRTVDIETFQHHMAKERKVSNSTLNQAVNAIRYYYKNVLGDAQRVTFIERPRTERKLPSVLSEEEVTALLRSVDNLKHRCILMLIYSAGLRLGELIALERSDVAEDRGQLIVRDGKGGKDRITLLSRKALDVLNEYLARY